MFLTCEDCQMSFGIQNEKQEILLRQQYVIVRANGKREAEMQKQRLERCTPRKFGEKLQIIDKGKYRFVILYHDLEKIKEEVENFITKYICPYCLKELMREKRKNVNE